MAVLIDPLKAGALGDPTNSIGSDVADSVNALIAAAQAADASIISMQAGKSDTSHSHPLATNSSNGFMSSADKIKLDSLVASGSSDAYLLNRNNHTGSQDMSTITGLVQTLANKSDTNHVHPDATTTVSGFLSFSDKVKLNTVASGATVNQTDAYLLSRANHTGSQAISTITGLSTSLAAKANATHIHANATVTVAGFMSNTDKVKLDAVAAGATLNQTDAYLLDRSNHTGSQAIASVTGLQTALDNKSASNHGHSVATTSVAGFMSALDKTKLESVATNASANQSDTHLLSRANHTGTQAISTVFGLEIALAGKQPLLTAGSGITIDTATWTISSTGGGGGGTTDHSALVNRNAVDQHSINSITGLAGELAAKAAVSHSHTDASTTVSGFMSYTDKIKLESINAGATVNSTDAFLLGRGNHTGTQAISTVATLQSVLDGKQPLNTQLTNFGTVVANATIGIFKKTAANTWSFTTLLATDIPSLNTSKLTAGTLPVARGGTGADTLTGLVYGNGTSAFTAATSAQLVTTLGFTPLQQGGGTGQGSNKVYIGWHTAGDGLRLQVDSTDFGKDFPINITGNSATTTKLATAVTINGVSFDGSASITVPVSGSVATANALTTARAISITGDATWTVNFKGDAPVSGVLTLKNSGVTANTYRSVTVNSQGIVTAGTNPTTLAGYQISDAVALSGDQTISGNKTFSNQLTGGNVVAVQALISRPFGGEGGQLVLGYTTSGAIGGQANNTWNIDVDSTNRLRFFRLDASGNSLIAAYVREDTGEFNIDYGLSLAGLAGNKAPLSIVTRAAAPTALVDGDIWHTGNEFYLRLNGTSRTLIHNGNPTALASDVTQAQAEAGTDTARRWFTPQRVKQAIAAQAVGISDTRLTNAREWTAATVTNAQALNGADTSRYAWTPQRVHEVADSKKLAFGVATRATISTSITISSKLAERTRTMIDTSAGNVTVTLTPSLYGTGDVEELVKIYPTNVLTITASSGVISLPDGTSAASHTLTGVRGTLVLDYISATELRLSAIF